MRLLTKDDILKNHIDNLKQYYVLDYLKKNLNVDEFNLYLDRYNNIKVVDRNNDALYFCYDEFKKEVIYDDCIISFKKSYEMEI